MDRCRVVRVVWLVALLCGLGPRLFAGVQSRVVTPISMERETALEHNVSPQALAAADMGTADPSLKLSTMTMHFSLSEAQQAALTELLLEQQQPGSANYHKWLTPEEYGARFGLSASDLAKVSGWLTGQGFTVLETARGGNFITFSGTAGQVQKALATTIHMVSADGETHYANLTDPAVPLAMANVVSDISGLHDFKVKPRAKSRVVAAPAEGTVHPNFTSSVSGNHYVAPGDFYTIYDESPLLNNSINGAGVTIAVMGQTDILLSDVAAFRAASGLPANVPTVKVYGNDPGTPSYGDQQEASLDVEWSGAAAPGASILYVNSADAIGTSLTQAINNAVAPIITISYGLCESGLGATSLNRYNVLFQQANAQGQTIVGPSGDSGAADCDYNATTAKQGLAVDFPASSPYVTGVGGTMFNEGTGTYWNSNSSSSVNNAGSALSYIPEAVWNETTGGSSFATAGGGISAYYARPSWQTGTGVPAGTTRTVPDVAFNAAVGHDGYLYCMQGSCVNGFRTSATATTACPTGGCLTVVGGTSVGAPSFAGILALVEQKTGSRLGNANPTIYALANSTYYASIFHDVTTGNNSVPCTAGTTNCTSGGTIGYNATTGYDLASGWGSVDAFNLVNDWNLYTGATTTTIATTTPSVTAGTAITFSSTVASASASTTQLTGNLQLQVDGTAVGSGVTIASPLSTGVVVQTVTATLSLVTTGLTAGTHTVTAAYSGGTSYAASSASMTVTIKASVATTPSVTTITTSTPNVIYGAAVSFPVTVASGASTSMTTPTGTVQLQVDSVNSGSPVTLVSGAATLTLSTSSLATGTHMVSAVYSGDGIYVTSMGSASINIGDFSLMGSTSSITVKAGATAAGVTYTVASLYNFAGTVSLSASSSSLNASATFVPTTVTLAAGGSGTSVFTLTAATSSSRQSLQAWNRGLAAGGGVVLAGFGLVFWPGRLRRLTRGALAAVLVSVAALGASGCGSSTSATSTGGSNSSTGTYAVTITASSGGISHATTLTVVVQ